MARPNLGSGRATVVRREIALGRLTLIGYGMAFFGAAFLLAISGAVSPFGLIFVWDDTMMFLRRGRASSSELWM